MEGTSISDPENLFKIFCDNDLELHRIQSLRTKEPETAFWIESFFSDGDVFFDVGANIGIYSLFARSKFPNLKVYCFEPFIKNTLRIGQNMALNNFGDVHVLPFALSNKNATTYFFSSDLRKGASGGQINSNTDEFGNTFEFKDKQSITTIRMDDLIKIFNIPQANHIKIDVDGAEDLIIEGMSEALKHSSLRSLLIEINQTSKKRQGFIDQMERLKFTLSNPYHMSAKHSRHRRAKKANNMAENLIFIKR